MEKFGQVIRKERLNKGLLLRQVAAQLEIDQAILSKIERNERKASREIIIKLADILEIDKKKLLIEYYSDKIVNEIGYEEVAIQVLKISEKKIKYLKKK